MEAIHMDGRLQIHHGTSERSTHTSAHGPRLFWLGRRPQRLPQGDPLASWLFLVAINLFHERLVLLTKEDGKQCGYRMGKAPPVVLKGYSDDTATIATTKKSAEEIHRSTL
jgi:hypothetical protein